MKSPFLCCHLMTSLSHEKPSIGPHHMVLSSENMADGWVPGWLSWLSFQFLISTQVMISLLVESSPAWGSMLSVEPVWDSLSLSLSLSPCPTHSLPPSLPLSLSLKINKYT